MFRSWLGDHPLAAKALHLPAALTYLQGGYEQSRARCRELTQECPRHQPLVTVGLVSAENDHFAGQREMAVKKCQAFIKRFPDDSRSSAARERPGFGRYIGRSDRRRPRPV